MYSAAKETDPLLPAYEPAPEIGGNKHHHSIEISDSQDQYESVESASDYNQNQPYPHHLHNPTSRRRNDEDDEDGTSPNPITSAMGRIFQTVFLFLFAVVFLAVAVSVFRTPSSDDDRQPPIDGSPRPPTTPEPRTIKERVNAILTSTPLIDGHNDLAIFIRSQYKNNITSPKFGSEFENGSMPLNVDLPRLRAGKAGGAFWSSFVVCPVNASYDMTDVNYATAVSHTHEQIDLLRRLQAQYPRDFTTSTTIRPEMLTQWHATRALFGPISIEGLHQVPPTAPMSTLRSYYTLGVRMATLTWNCHNPFADASLVFNSLTSPPIVVNSEFRPHEGAVTTRGRAVIREMNRLGMIIDISHTSYWTQRAVLTNSTSRAPVVFSHSSAYTLCPHPRNVKDDILDLVKQTRSLVMVNFSPAFISCTSDPAAASDAKFSIPKFFPQNSTLHQVARHITYIGARIGYDHVGIGSDFDGMGTETPRGLDGVDKFPDLVAELLRMGVSDTDARKIVGGNILRVWGDVDEMAARMKAQGVEPGVDDASGY
ncbi:hypothetical protein H2198_004462 [Neophaeococcomyces mojaviensis]|uniref:Uncharacterized protein n=1 Tax=Neophaeococcomyces mojaviensis TaxID=3383035 RepID=A0ACC3A8I4_9EURO|nr:hypothetical protein H2198_004462 [Knufia sp. JES_112]